MQPNKHGNLKSRFLSMAGSILFVIGILFTCGGVVSMVLFLTGQIHTDSMAAQILSVLFFLALTVLSAGILRIGWRLKKHQQGKTGDPVAAAMQKPPMAPAPVSTDSVQKKADGPAALAVPPLREKQVGLIRISEFSRGYTKFYRCRKTIQPVPFLKMLRAHGIPVEKVFIKRDAEMDMQFDIGDYTLEDLAAVQKRLEYGPACQFTLNTSIDHVPVEIHFSDDSTAVYLVTPEKELDIPMLEQGVPILDRDTDLLTYDHTSNLWSIFLKAYTITAPYTPVDCLLILSLHPDFSIACGKREEEHDVGFGSSMDYDSYSSFQNFLDSGDYETYAGNSFISDYRFGGSYGDSSFEIGFADRGIMTLRCHDEQLDLCRIIEEVKSDILKI